jgi:tetratricopeptide (TPR) repeat protein
MATVKPWNLLWNICCLAGIVWFQSAYLGLSQPAKAPLTFGFSNLIADWQWLQYVQYFGDQQARMHSGYGQSESDLEQIATFNPQFLLVYVQANYAVAEAMKQPEKAVQFLLKGAQENPGKPDTLGMPGTWYLYRLAASIVFRHFNDYERSAQLFTLAAAEPGAPAVMKENAAYFFHAANDQERAIRLWQEFYEEAPTAQMKRAAREKLASLHVSI